MYARVLYYIRLMATIVVRRCLILVGVIRVSLRKSHFLNRLLRLELISVGLYIGLIGGFVLYGLDKVYSIFYLVIAVGERVLGLSLIISFCYKYGSENVKAANMVVC